MGDNIYVNRYGVRGLDWSGSGWEQRAGFR